MELHELEKEKFEKIKDISEANLKISEAKNVLVKLQEEETEYLVEREKKALVRIDKVLAESRQLLDQTQGNYEEVHKFCQMVSGFAEFLTEAHGKFTGLLEDFNTRSEEWDREVERRENELAGIRKGLDLQRTLIENDKKGIEQANKKIEKEKKKIESDRGTIERAIKRLKEGRI